MMIEQLETLLKKTNGISAYRITEICKQGLEWYHIGTRLESARSKDITEYEVAVYADSDNGKHRGACTFTIQPTMSVPEIQAGIDRALATAQSIHNDWFPIPDIKHTQNPVSILESKFAQMMLPEAMQKLYEALYRYNGFNGARINSLELFLTKINKRIKNSKGIDISFSYFHGYTEFIVNAGSESNEIELYGKLLFSEPDFDKLSNEVKHKLTQAVDRLAAVPTPDCTGLPVVLSDSPAEAFYSYWFDAVQNTAMYQHTNPFALGEDVCGRETSGNTNASGGIDASGDIINLTAVPFVPCSPLSGRFDNEGFALQPVTCIKEGKLITVIGPMKYAHYLALPAYGNHPLFELAGGKHSQEELLQSPHLEAVSFSDFYIDPSTGNFGGELRLGYLFKDGKRIPVTGGSVTGSIPENRGYIKLSRELYDYSTCHAPKICLIPRARIANAE